MWKLSIIAHYFKKSMDAELCEEILDSIIFNLEQGTLNGRVLSNDKPLSVLGKPQLGFGTPVTKLMSQIKNIKRSDDDDGGAIEIEDI